MKPRKFYIQVAKDHGFEDALLVYCERWGVEDEVAAPYVIKRLQAIIWAKEELDKWTKTLPTSG